ncbi:unnamed protein product [Rotaria sordida]|uniref:Uncharacterized protein n=1 Tax=Rotaria sordida TaxID=392033 RepID=A0A814PBU2_9BILA|nr:unnamed protein product [Rotaria sordida]
MGENKGKLYYDLTNKIDLKAHTQSVLISSTINLNPLVALFNLNDRDMNYSQTIFEYLDHELTVRFANDLIYARIEQAYQQLDCTLLKTTTIISLSTFISLCTGLSEKELIKFNDTTHSIINEDDLLIALHCNLDTVNTQDYIQLQD